MDRQIHYFCLLIFSSEDSHFPVDYPILAMHSTKAALIVKSAETDTEKCKQLVECVEYIHAVGAADQAKMLTIVEFVCVAALQSIVNGLNASLATYQAKLTLRIFLIRKYEAYIKKCDDFASWYEQKYFYKKQRGIIFI